MVLREPGENLQHQEKEKYEFIEELRRLEIPRKAQGVPVARGEEVVGRYGGVQGGHRGIAGASSYDGVTFTSLLTTICV